MGPVRVMSGRDSRQDSDTEMTWFKLTLFSKPTFSKPSDKINSDYEIYLGFFLKRKVTKKNAPNGGNTSS